MAFESGGSVLCGSNVVSCAIGCVWVRFNFSNLNSTPQKYLHDNRERKSLMGFLGSTHIFGALASTKNRHTAEEKKWKWIAGQSPYSNQQITFLGWKRERREKISTSDECHVGIWNGYETLWVRSNQSANFTPAYMCFVLNSLSTVRSEFPAQSTNTMELRISAITCLPLLWLFYSLLNTIQKRE